LRTLQDSEICVLEQATEAVDAGPSRDVSWNEHKLTNLANSTDAVNRETLDMKILEEIETNNTVV